jgi:hypothetical protein
MGRFYTRVEKMMVRDVHRITLAKAEFGLTKSTPPLGSEMEPPIEVKPSEKL